MIFSLSYFYFQKNTTLRQNYKRLEEEHYKAQEKIQLLQCQSKRSSLVGNEEMPVSTSTLFACEHCTKNFLSEELLRAHNNRKHIGKECPDQQHEKLQSELKQLKEKMNAAEKEIFQINSNNNNNDIPAPTKTAPTITTTEATDTVCSVCSKKSERAVSSVAIQCEDEMTMEKVQSVDVVSTPNIAKEDIVKKPSEIPIECEVTSAPSSLHEQTIAELKAEVAELQSALRKKFVEEQVANERVTQASTTSASDKIDVIQQRFTAFETMYVKSQHEFIESFRDLDERQKNYMHDIQDSIKEIVEKSLGRYGTPVATENVGTTTMSPLTTATTTTTAQVHVNSTKDTIEATKKQLTEPIKNVDTETDLREGIADESSESVSSGDDSSVDKNATALAKVSPKAEKQSKLSARRPSKTNAVNEFENRLHQIGVDANVSGLSTPHTVEVAKELAEERAEIKKAHKTFASTRNKLNSEVERIAKAKLTSASSVTSLSSHRSDDDVTSHEDSGNVKRRKNVRPKSAKRDSSNVLRKFVANDIDESDLMGKMKMAQKAIDAHRECIQELLQTTAHSPKTMATASASKQSINSAKESTQDDESNRYNKMPNVTTRRVVFVNLDEDS